MSKRTAVLAGLAAYLAVIVIPVLILVAIGLMDALSVTYVDKMQLERELGTNLSLLHAKGLTLTTNVIFAAKVGALLTIVAAFPFGLYLAIVNMLCGKPSRVMAPPPIQDFEP